MTAKGEALLDKGRRSLSVARQLLDGGHADFDASAEQVRRTLDRAKDFLRIAGEILDSAPPDRA